MVISIQNTKSELIFVNVNVYESIEVEKRNIDQQENIQTKSSNMKILLLPHCKWNFNSMLDK